MSDIQRARAWYCALLDVEEPPITDGRTCRLVMQAASLTLQATEGVAEAIWKAPPFALHAESLKRVDAFLRRHGIQATAGDGAITFHDPDGNMLMVAGPAG
ncbi:MAG TPA: VOC family protein [Bacillota bacterium]|nr:VOC family protein [Bacillota bacterium]